MADENKDNPEIGKEHSGEWTTTPEKAIPSPPLAPVAEQEESTSYIVTQAHGAADRIEKANIELAKLLAKQERMTVEKALGGKTEAGTEKKEDSPEDYAKKVMANEIETTDT